MTMESKPEFEAIRAVLTKHYEEEIIETFISYCCDEEYDIVNIFEDISDINDSCIYEYMQNKFKWNNQQTNTFIQKLLHSNSKNFNDGNKSDELELIASNLSIMYSTDIIKIFFNFCEEQQVYILIM